MKDVHFLFKRCKRNIWKIWGSDS